MYVMVFVLLNTLLMVILLLFELVLVWAYKNVYNIGTVVGCNIEIRNNISVDIGNGNW